MNCFSASFSQTALSSPKCFVRFAARLTPLNSRFIIISFTCDAPKNILLHCYFVYRYFNIIIILKNSKIPMLIFVLKVRSTQSTKGRAVMRFLKVISSSIELLADWISQKCDLIWLLNVFLFHCYFFPCMFHRVVPTISHIVYSGCMQITNINILPVCLII